MLIIISICKNTRIIIIIKIFKDDYKGIMNILLYRQKQNHCLLKFSLSLLPYPESKAHSINMDILESSLSSVLCVSSLLC